jgi:integrase
MPSKTDNVVQLRQPPNKAKFSQPFVDKLVPRKDGFIWDLNHSGFAIRTSRHNSKRYYTVARCKGKPNPTKVLIGDTSAFNLRQAIAEHKENMALMSRGINPNTIHEGKIEEKETSIGKLVADTIARKVEAKKYSTRNIVLQEGLLKNHIKDIGHKTFSSLTDADIQKFYFSKTPAVARQCISLLSVTFNSIPPRDRSDNENPAEMIRRLQITVSQPTRIERYLDPDVKNGSIPRFFEACQIALEGYCPDDHYLIPKDFVERDYVDFLMFALLTALRRANILDLEWSEVDFDVEEIKILKPKGKEYENKPAYIPMTDYTRALLESRFKNRDKRSNKVFPVRERYINNQALRIALVMIVHGKFIKKKDNPIYAIVKKLFGVTLKEGEQYSFFERLRYEMVVKRSFNLHDLATQPHDVRRSLSNVADIIGVSSKTIDTMLMHSAKTTQTKHYSRTQKATLGQALHDCCRYMDNRVSEYLGKQTRFEAKNPKPPMTATVCKSAILEFYGQGQAWINVDDFKGRDIWWFPDDKPKQKRYGDLEIND